MVNLLKAGRDMVSPINRQSSRLIINENSIIIDQETKKRRLQKHFAALEKDNVQEDPHANLVWNKAIPNFSDDFVYNSSGGVLVGSKAKKRKRTSASSNLSTSQTILDIASSSGGGLKSGEIMSTKKGMRLRAELAKTRFRKTFLQLLGEEEQKLKEEDPEIRTYTEICAPPSTQPPQKFCSVCGLYSKYNCIKCFSRFCSLGCREVHTDTRCLKWTA